MAHFTSDRFCRGDGAQTIDLINRTFQLRTCDIEIDGKAPRPCLEYHIKRCLGPCVKGLCTPEEYQEAVRDVRMLLEGRNTELAGILEERMLHASERCVTSWPRSIATLRKTVIKLSEQQKMATTSESDVDIFGYYREGKRLALQLFTMREGDIVGAREFFWEDLPEEDFNPASFLSEVLMQYYSSTSTAPTCSRRDPARTTRSAHLVSCRARFTCPSTSKIANCWSRCSRTTRRRVHIPCATARREARHDRPRRKEREARLRAALSACLKPDMKRVLEEMQETLELPRFPARLSRSISRTSRGRERRRAWSVCENGKMNRNEYRKFKIRWKEGAGRFRFDARRQVTLRTIRSITRRIFACLNCANEQKKERFMPAGLKTSIIASDAAEL
jgi:excinuclease ABC subunit C